MTRQIHITIMQGRVLLTVQDATGKVITELEGDGEDARALEPAVVQVVTDTFREAIQ